MCYLLCKAYWILIETVRWPYKILLISSWILFRIKLTFPLMRSISSLWNRCWIVTESFPHVTLARVEPSFLICLISAECQAPNTSIGRGTKFMPSALHAGPYVFHLVLYACWTPYPAFSAVKEIYHKCNKLNMLVTWIKFKLIKFICL